MTKEEKKQLRQERSQRRKHKRYLKDQESFYKAYHSDRNSISWGRKRLAGTQFECDMRYSSCELRGYCNGDC
jgi:hypothetical protein